MRPSPACASASVTPSAFASAFAVSARVRAGISAWVEIDDVVGDQVKLRTASR